MLARRWRSWLQKKILDPSASHFSFAFILVYLYKTQGGRPAFSQFRWPFCGTRVLVANAATNSTSLHFTTICLVRKMASFARVHRKPDAQQFGVTSTTPRFTLFWWMEHLFPNNLQCPAQRIPLPFAFLNHALFLVLSHTEFASPTPLHKISLCLAHWKNGSTAFMLLIGLENQNQREWAQEYMELMQIGSHFFLGLEAIIVWKRVSCSWKRCFLV